MVGVVHLPLFQTVQNKIRFQPHSDFNSPITTDWAISLLDRKDCANVCKSTTEWRSEPAIKEVSTKDFWKLSMSSTKISDHPVCQTFNIEFLRQSYMRSWMKLFYTRGWSQVFPIPGYCRSKEWTRESRLNSEILQKCAETFLHRNMECNSPPRLIAPFS